MKKLLQLDTQNFKTNHHKSIAPKQEGPFEIKERLGPITYQLKLPKTWKIHNIFHAALLCPYIKNEIYGNNYPRPPVKLLEEEVYKVDSILKHQRRGRGYQYYIKWKGYLITGVAWENESAFSENGNILWNNTNSETNSESLSIMTCLQCNCLNLLLFSEPKPQNLIR